MFCASGAHALLLRIPASKTSMVPTLCLINNPVSDMLLAQGLPAQPAYCRHIKRRGGGVFVEESSGGWLKSREEAAGESRALRFRKAVLS